MHLAVVADEQDGLAADFVAYCATRGRRARRLSVAAAAATFSVDVQQGITRVVPEVPIFLRACGVAADHASFDDEFLCDEATAAVWSAAALTPSVVVNRPTPAGYLARLSSTASISEHRAGAPRRSEIFMSELAKSEHWDGWWAADALSDERFVYDQEKPRPDVPHRLRPGIDHPGYEQVMVVGTQSWRTSRAPLARLELESHSLRYAHRLGLRFACLTWMVGRDLRTATLTHINPWPQWVAGDSNPERVFRALEAELFP